MNTFTNLLVNLQDFESKDILKMIKSHMELKDISDVVVVEYEDEYVELIFSDLIKGFNRYYQHISKYKNIKQLLRDFEDFLQDDDTLGEVASDVYFEGHSQYLSKKGFGLLDTDTGVRQSDFI